MGLFDRLANLLGLRKKEVNVLVVGLNNSGKSTVINNFKREDDRCIDIVPTVGFNVEKFAYKFFNLSIGVLDNILFMSIDTGITHFPSLPFPSLTRICTASDKLRLVVVKEELDMLLQHPDVAGRKIPILFLANKMDLPDSLTTVKLVAGLGLERIQNKPWHIRATNALTGEGLQPAIEWLTDQIRDIYINKR
ncbi:ADP-ribosylation factor-like protein 6 [Trachymyrmex zeteki]|uniref:ADP-ribosylation factor-like protein 6 n=1 Tax=Mycetomoellerius zeteki TaxID=64791 RepID=A0A151WQC0_9HYME|nr:ADP-ribosylation factor-like protein 6 [Trachymyrmex zeteki]